MKLITPMINIIDLIKKLNQSINKTKAISLISLFCAIVLMWVSVTLQTWASISSWLLIIPFRRFCWYHRSDHNTQTLWDCHVSCHVHDDRERYHQDNNDTFVQDSKVVRSIGCVFSHREVHDSVVSIPNNCPKLCVEKLSILSTTMSNPVLFCIFGIYCLISHMVWSCNLLQSRFNQVLVHRNVPIYVTANKIDVDHSHRCADLQR